MLQFKSKLPNHNMKILHMTFSIYELCIFFPGYVDILVSTIAIGPFHFHANCAIAIKEMPSAIYACS